MRIKKGMKLAGWILAILLYEEAVRYARWAEDAARIFDVSLTGNLPDTKRAEEICKEEVSCCFWRETKGETVQCLETGRSGSVTVLTFLGNGELVVPGSGILTLQTGICMLEDNLAEKLFGTNAVGGQTISYNGNVYTVCGTVGCRKPMVILGTKALEEDSFDHLSLKLKEGENPDIVWERFFLQYGFHGSRMDLQPLCILVSNLCLLFPAAVFLRWNRNKKEQGRCMSNLPRYYRRPLLRIGKGTSFLLFCLIFGSFLWIPRQMIPSRWSDFSFWTAQIKQQRENWLAFFGNELGERQLSLLFVLLRSAACSLLAWILTVRKT